MANILIAASPQPRAVAERILAGYELTCVETLEGAAKKLRRQAFDLILCTILFDDSRMFDFLRLAKSKPEWARIPFVCARLKAHVVSEPIAWEAIDLACAELGATAFLNISDYPKDFEGPMRRAIEANFRAEGKK